MADDLKGLIFNIQRFSIHDGPGIRTTVFMQGCPLKCRWCSNPESWQAHPIIMTRNMKCIRCGKCVQACPIGAITMDEKEGRRIDWAQCNQCLECAHVCPAEAIVVCGKYMSLGEVMAEVESDRLFYQNSGGGATVSGGEPLSQPEFVQELLKRCKERELHTALDTSGYAPWSKLEKILEYVDLVLFDVKHLDPHQHREGTGQSNELILDNLEKTAAKVRTWLRVPLIPGYNDSVEHITKLAELGRRVGAEKISLLPYHEWGKAKYEQIGRHYSMDQTPAPTPEHLQELQEIIQGLELKATISS